MMDLCFTTCLNLSQSLCVTLSFEINYCAKMVELEFLKNHLKMEEIGHFFNKTNKNDSKTTKNRYI